MNRDERLDSKKSDDPRPKLLVVDDEAVITSQLQPFFERAGFQVLIAVTGEDALRKIPSFLPDLIILDIIMPEINGREVLRRLRQAGDWTHVIMLTQVLEVGERVQALDEGADDYLNKPFEPQELLARVRAVLRRARPTGSAIELGQKLRCGPLLLDRQARCAHLGQTPLNLNPKAFQVLEYLMTHPGQMVERDELLEKLWGDDSATSPRSVDVRIYALRQALRDDAGEPRYIETAARQGYRFIGRVEVLL